MGLRSRLRQSLGLEQRQEVAWRSPSTLTPSFVGNSPYDVWLPDRASEQVVAVYRAFNMTADAVAQLPWAAWRGGPGTAQAAVVPLRSPVDPQPALLVNPSPRYTPAEFKNQVVMSLMTRGNAYVFLNNVDPEGFPTTGFVVNPQEVQVSWNENQTFPVYRWRNQMMTPGLNWLHIPLIRNPGELLGMGPIEAARRAVNSQIATDEYARRLFTDNATPPGIVTHPGRLTKNETEDLKAQWMGQHSGGDRSPAVVGGGLEFRAIAITPEDAQFLQTRIHGIQELARLFGIPHWLMNAGTPSTSASLTYQNVAQVFVEWTKTTLAPTYLNRIEEAFTTVLPRGQRVEFDTSEFLRTDIGTRFEAYKTAIESGWLTTDEVRAREGLQPTGVTSDVGI